MRALVMGFEGWGGRINPSGTIAKLLDGKKFGNLAVTGRELPENFKSLPRIVARSISTVKPDIVISTGWDYISKISVEKVSLNVMNSRFGSESVPDNYGNEPNGGEIIRKAPLALRATFPAEEIVDDLSKVKIPAYVSYQAGTHCCNTVMFSVLYHTMKSKKSPISGFIHIPPVKEMKLKGSRVKPMKLSEEIKAIETALKTCRNYLDSKNAFL
jgi:pyroglutamyl-peptidase